MATVLEPKKSEQDYTFLIKKIRESIDPPDHELFSEIYSVWFSLRGKHDPWSLDENIMVNIIIELANKGSDGVARHLTDEYLEKTSASLRIGGQQEIFLSLGVKLLKELETREIKQSVELLSSTKLPSALLNIIDEYNRMLHVNLLMLALYYIRVDDPKAFENLLKPLLSKMPWKTMAERWGPTEILILHRALTTSSNDAAYAVLRLEEVDDRDVGTAWDTVPRHISTYVMNHFRQGRSRPGALILILKLMAKGMPFPFPSVFYKPIMLSKILGTSEIPTNETCQIFLEMLRSGAGLINNHKKFSQVQYSIIIEYFRAKGIHVLEGTDVREPEILLVCPRFDQRTDGKTNAETLITTIRDLERALYAKCNKVWLEKLLTTINTAGLHVRFNSNVLKILEGAGKRFTPQFVQPTSVFTPTLLFQATGFSSSSVVTSSVVIAPIPIPLFSSEGVTLPERQHQGGPSL